MDTVIKAMTPRDITEIVKIIKSHDAFDGDRAATYFEAYFADRDRRKSPTEKNYVLSPAPAEPVVGIGGFMPDRYNTPDIYWITWLYVKETYRGRRYGLQLLQYVVGRLERLKARKLYLDTSNDPIYRSAIALYQSFGFQKEGVLKDYYRKGEDFLIFGKSL